MNPFSMLICSTNKTFLIKHLLLFIIFLLSAEAITYSISYLIVLIFKHKKTKLGKNGNTDLEGC